MKFILRNKAKDIDVRSYYDGDVFEEELVFDGIKHKYNIIELENVVELVAWIDGLEYEGQLSGNPQQADYLIVTIEDDK